MTNPSHLSLIDVERFIEGCVHNVKELRANLTGIGYQFARSDGPVQFANEGNREIIADCERSLGELPFLVRRWYETFRYVDFSQDARQFQDRSASAGGLGLNVTLVVLEIEKCIEFRQTLKQSGTVVDREHRQTFLPFGTFASNCEPKGVWLPDSATDPVIYDDGGGPVLFSQELRNAFRSGGFPFWEHMYRKPVVLSSLGFAPNYPGFREELRRNLVDL